MSRKTQKFGFTMIELVIVVAIIGLLATIAVPSYFKFVGRAKVAVVKQNMHTVRMAMEAYSADQLGGYPLQADEPALKALLPDGTYPDNPFNNLETVMSWNVDPAGQGEMAIANLAGGGYSIKARGEVALLDPIVVGE